MPSIVWKGSSTYMTAGVNTALVEQPDSPAYTFGDSPKCVRKYRGLHALCLSSMPGINTVGTGDMAGWIVKEVAINRLPKQIGELIVTWGASPEGGAGTGGAGLPLPPDEIGLVPFDIQRKVETNPYFATLDVADRGRVRRSFDSSSREDRNAADSEIASSAHATLEQALVEKLQKGIETYYFAGWTYTWTYYSFDFPTSVSAGSVIETPGGPLASLLTSNPDIDWLRQADSIDPGTYPYKITQTWLGASQGHWDHDLYA